MFVTLLSSTAEQSALNQCSVQTFTESEDTRCCVNTIFPPEDGHVNAMMHGRKNIKLSKGCFVCSTCKFVREFNCNSRWVVVGLVCYSH